MRYGLAVLLLACGGGASSGPPPAPVVKAAPAGPRQPSEDECRHAYDAMIAARGATPPADAMDAFVADCREHATAETVDCVLHAADASEIEKCNP